MKLRLDPIVEIPLRPFGVNVRMGVHLLNRDPANIVEIFVNHVYDKYCPIQDNEVVIDCGAYVGEFTIQAAKRVGIGGLVLAFEPNPKSFALCKSNIDRNGIRNVRLFQFALGEKEGRVHFKADKTNYGASTIIPQKEHDSRSTVGVVTLSQFHPLFADKTIKLLKIDVEGSATRIALGATSLLQGRVVRNVSAEIHPGEEGLQPLLESHGFHCIRENNYLYATLAHSPR